MNNEIKLFEGNQIHFAWDNEKEEWYFSVVDIVAILADSVDPKQYIKKSIFVILNLIPIGVQFVPQLK